MWESMLVDYLLSVLMWGILWCFHSLSIPSAWRPHCCALWLTCGLRLCAQIRTKLRDLQLDDDLVWKREEAREASPEWVKAPWFIQAFYILLCWVRATPLLITADFSLHFVKYLAEVIAVLSC